MKMILGPQRGPQNEMGSFVSKRGHPQPTLIPFYRVTLVYLTYEAILVALWILHMLLIKFLMGRLGGFQFRESNEANLFHFTAPIGIWTAVQQTANDNSVSWWAIFPIMVAFGRDLSAILNIAVGHLERTAGVEQAWNAAVAENVLHMVGTLFAFLIYIWFFVLRRARDLPSAVAFRRGKLRKPDMEEPLLLDESKKK